MKNMFTDLQFGQTHFADILFTCLLKLQKLTPSEMQDVFCMFAAAAVSSLGTEGSYCTVNQLVFKVCGVPSLCALEGQGRNVIKKQYTGEDIAIKICTANRSRRLSLR